MMHDLSRISYVMAGFSSGLISHLDNILPPASLAIIEEPDVAEMRRVAERCQANSCFAGLVHSPIHDEDNIVNILDSLPSFREAKVVFPGVEYGVVAAAALGEQLGVPGASLKAAQALRNKARLREAAGKKGLRQPRWFRVSSAREAERARRDLGCDCVLKPANRQASVGVQLLSADDDIQLAWQRAVSADEPRLRARRELPASFLVEERMIGPEVSVECLVSNSRVLFQNITAKSVFPGPFPVESGHTVPGDISPETASRLHECMDLLISATGFRTGILHAEWILIEGHAPGLVECAGRMPGDALGTLIDHSYGGSLVGSWLAILAGTEQLEPRKPQRAAAIRFLAPSAGTVREVHGTETACSMPGIVDVSIYVQPGQVLPEIITSATRAGHVLSVADSPAAAASQADAAIAAIHIAMGE